MANIEGLDEYRAKIQALIDGLPQALAGAAHEFGGDIMAVSNDRCPVDKGVLLASANVSDPQIADGVVTVELSYSTPYALYVHEEMREVKWTRPGSGPKYLENPGKEMENQFPDRIAKAVEGLLS